MNIRNEKRPGQSLYNKRPGHVQGPIDRGGIPGLLPSLQGYLQIDGNELRKPEVGWQVAVCLRLLHRGYALKLWGGSYEAWQPKQLLSSTR